jgi:ubiquinone/menaquinone biosynthesis C-methylase UbiE
MASVLLVFSRNPYEATLMSPADLSDNFYDKIKLRLHQRVGRELRLAYRVLDLGCGACELARYLSETYGQKVTGVDISANSLPNKRNIAKDTGHIRCIRKDAARLSFIRDEAIDAAIIFWALHEMKKPQAILHEAHRVLRAGGKVLVVEFPRNSLAQKLWNENYYTGEELADSLREAGFEDVRAKRIEHKQILWVNGYRAAN